MSTSLFFQSSVAHSGLVSSFEDEEAAVRSQTRRANGLRVQVGPLPPLAQLEPEWRLLEARGDAAFFTSWTWIGAMLMTVPSLEDLRLARVTRGFETVGLCVIGRLRQAWRGPWTRTALSLNATGDADLDRITIEFNDVLCDSQCAREVRRDLVKALVRMGNHWDELHLPGIRAGSVLATSHPARIRSHVRSEPCFAVDLEALRATPSGAPWRDRYLALLSSNTRSQVRRSIKAYEAIGNLALTEARSVEEALQFLDGLRDMHQAYWIERGEPGAFGHPYFGRFHRQLIRDAFGRGEIQMLRLSAGSTVIGYLYNFVKRGHVFNYQSGFDYQLAGKLGRPGLVMHALAIAMNAERGRSIYDFMAGANRSKESLATVRYTMDWVTLRQPRLKFWIDARLRAVKGVFHRGRPSGAAGVQATPADPSQVDA